jgi:hypothetical protein
MAYGCFKARFQGSLSEKARTTWSGQRSRSHALRLQKPPHLPALKNQFREPAGPLAVGAARLQELHSLVCVYRALQERRSFRHLAAWCGSAIFSTDLGDHYTLVGGAKPRRERRAALRFGGRHTNVQQPPSGACPVDLRVVAGTDSKMRHARGFAIAGLVRSE